MFNTSYKLLFYLKNFHIFLQNYIKVTNKIKSYEKVTFLKKCYFNIKFIN